MDASTFFERRFECLFTELNYYLLLLSPAILRESIASSEIENIHTTMIEVLQNQLFPEKEQRETDKEVLRYRDAILWGKTQLEKLPISTRLILGIQNKLIPSSHGNYRQQQNAIVNHRTMQRIYTPPVARDIPQLMSNWETFINMEEGIDPLIKAAISHYQFEAIHPFEDGNGRTGRILMVLYLVSVEVLDWPILFISGYINKNRSEYYQLLNDITNNNKWDEFILFMLNGFYLQAKETRELLLKIMRLFEEYKQKSKIEHRKIYSADLVEALFTFPIITPVKLGKELGIHYATASRHLHQLAKAKMLGEQKVGKYHFFINKELLKVMQSL
ncbi:Fic family protein [Candidatus Saganbacteria bacterium]|nr:Fic family protein [Candidatus Saganbacteria bacterium]